MRAASQVTSSGGSAWRVDRPPAKLPTRGLPSWQTIVSVSGVILSAEATLRGKRDFERAQRESDEGRIQAAADRMMQPFSPQKEENKVIERGVIKAIQQRILHWHEHATIIAGRFGSGKSVAVQDALRGRQGVYVHRVKGKDWEEKLYEALDLDNELMLETVLRKIGEKLGKPPVLVLDIPRSTKEGGGFEAFGEVLFAAFADSEAWAPSPASPRLSRRTGRWRTPGPEDSVVFLQGCGRVLQVVRALPR